MAADDRKRRILDHLTKSSDGVKYVPQKNTASNNPVLPPEVITPLPSSSPAKRRKRQVMEHLSLSSQEFGDFSLDDDTDLRKQQIQNHIRKSLS